MYTKKMGAGIPGMGVPRQSVSLDMIFHLTRQMNVRELEALIKHCQRLIIQLVKNRKKNVYETLKSYLQYSSSNHQRNQDLRGTNEWENQSRTSTSTWSSCHSHGQNHSWSSTRHPVQLRRQNDQDYPYCWSSRSRCYLPYNETPEDARANFNRKWSLSATRNTLDIEAVKQQKQRNLNDYHLLKVVGKGAFGKVLLVQCRYSGQFYAMKVLEKRTIIKSNNLKGVLNEKRILQCVSFPFLVKLDHHFKDAANLYMVMEFVGGGDLFFHLRRKQQFTEKESQFYAGQVVLSMEYLHSLGIVFRDLKPENILVNHDGYIKLTDFGLAKRLLPLGRTRTMLGTAEYLAPEMFLQKPYGKSVDWWAVGILLFEMVHGRSPFRSNSDSETFEKIVSGKVKFGQATPQLKNLVTHLLQEDPSNRLGTESADDVKNHPWFESLNWKMLLEKKIEAPYIPRLMHRGDTRFFDKYPDDFSALRHVPSQAQDVYRDSFADF